MNNAGDSPVYLSPDDFLRKVSAVDEEESQNSNNFEINQYTMYTNLKINSAPFDGSCTEAFGPTKIFASRLNCSMNEQISISHFLNSIHDFEFPQTHRYEPL